MLELFSIDPAIREVVAELNRRGLVTTASCAGHPEEGLGQILFKKKYSHRLIKEILGKYDINILSLREITNPWYPTPRTEVEFGYLGGEAVEFPIEVEPEVLPRREEAISYFRDQGVDEKEAKHLARLYGYARKEKGIGR